MKASIRIEDPESVVATVSISMPIKNWKDLRGRIDCRVYPEQRLYDVIRDLVIAIETKVSAVDPAASK